MRAAVMQDFGKPLLLQDVPVPEPGEGDVLLRVLSSGVCHSDVHIVDGDLPRFRAGTKPRLIPGHEVVGIVERIGDSVTELKPGDRAGVAWCYSACGECEQCREGLENLCRKGGVTGLTHDGGYAQFIRARASHAIKVPDNVSSDEAAPLFCAGVTSYRALRNAGAGPGMRVAVFGVGGLGHLAVQIAKAMGATIIAMDVSPDKLQLALELGAHHAFDASGEDGIKAVRKLGGVHIAVVTSAARAAYDTAMQCLRPAGTLSVVGLPAQPLQVAALALVAAETKIIGSAVGTRADIREVLDMASKGLIRCHVQARPLADVNEVLDAMRRGEIQARVVLHP